VPLAVMFNTLLSSFQLWNQRKKAYKNFSLVSIVSAFILVLISCLSGLLHFTDIGLIIGYVFAPFIALVVLLALLGRTQLSFIYTSISLVEQRKVFFNYINFPKYLLLSEILYTFTLYITPIFFSIIYNSTVVGHFTLANRIVRLPIIVFMNALANVFKNEASVLYGQTGSCKSLYNKVLKKIIFIGLIPFILLILTVPWLFKVFFGANWYEAGVYGSILSVMLYFEFVAIPFKCIYIITGRQKVNLIVQVFNTSCQLGAIYLGFVFFNNARYSITFFSLASLCFSLLDIYLTYWYADKSKNQ
jgi:O-antigen/teichoic acid export membrane protein